MNPALQAALTALSDARTLTALILLLLGALLLVLGAIGQMRMPDVYTRLHAAAPLHSLGGALVLAALAIDAWDWRFALRAGLLAALLAVFGPMLINLLASAAHAAGLAPRVGKLDPDGR